MTEDMGPWTVIVKSTYHVAGPCSPDTARRAAKQYSQPGPPSHDERVADITHLNTTTTIHLTNAEPFDDDSYFITTEETPDG